MLTGTRELKPAGLSGAWVSPAFLPPSHLVLLWAVSGREVDSFSSSVFLNKAFS